MSQPIESFEEFWPFYVRQHLSPLNRALHFVGTTLAVVTAVQAIRKRRPLGLLVAPLLGYGPAWVGHFFVENNKPATFTYPLWSLRGDFRMWLRIAQRRMGDEVKAAEVSQSS